MTDQNKMSHPKTTNLTNTNLSDKQLEDRLKLSVAKEMEMKIQILHLLAEVERRRLYSQTHPSLFEYCVKVLKYSGGSAQRRIDTMRAMKLMPEIETKIQTGDLQMVTVSQAQTFFRQEKKSGKTYDLEAKRQVLAKLENKSSRECEKELVAISPQSVRPDTRREINPDRTELRITLNQELDGKLDQLKALLSNKHPHLTDQELIAVLADIALKKLDPAQKQPTKTSEPLPTLEVHEPSTVNIAGPVGCGKPVVQNWFSITQTTRNKPKPSRYIPATMKQDVWMRDKGKCTHPGCNSNHRLQYDHIVPLGKGGESSVKNLRLLCQAHNLLAAQREFGEEKIAEFVDRT